MGAEGGSLRLAVGSRDTVRLPFMAVDRLEQSAGSRPNYAKGALIGGGVGLAVGLALGVVGNGLAQAGCETPDGCPRDLGSSLAVGGVLGAGVGAGMGVLVASVFKGERWQPVTGLGHKTSAIGLRLRL